MRPFGTPHGRPTSLLFDSKKDRTRSRGRGLGETPFKPSSSMNRQSSRIDGECAAIEAEIARVRDQIRELLVSDESTYLQELQEESKIIFQERLRVMGLHEEHQNSLKEAERVLSELEAVENDHKDDAEVAALQQRIDKYEDASAKLRLRLDRAKQENGGDGTFEETAAQLRRKISELRQETSEIRESTTRSTEQHRLTMQHLKESLSQKGLS